MQWVMIRLTVSRDRIIRCDPIEGHGMYSHCVETVSPENDHVLMMTTFDVLPILDGLAGVVAESLWAVRAAAHPVVMSGPDATAAELVELIGSSLSEVEAAAQIALHDDRYEDVARIHAGACHLLADARAQDPYGG